MSEEMKNQNASSDVSGNTQTAADKLKGANQTLNNANEDAKARREAEKQKKAEEEREERARQ